MALNLKLETNAELEAEIKLLAKEIEVKRRTLEGQENIVEEKDDKEIIRKFLTDRDDLVNQLTEKADFGKTDPAAEEAIESLGHRHLDEEHLVIISNLVAEVNSGGIKKAIKKAKQYPAAVIDAFHDLLVNELYETLKARKVVE